MGFGTGILLIAVGAALSWAIDIDVPYVSDDAVGLILLLAGIAVVVVSAILSTDHPETGIGTGMVLFAAGAILSWAVEVDVPFIADYAMGIILMVAGAVSVVATLMMISQRRREQLRYQDQRYDQAYGRPAPPFPDRY